MAPYSRLPEGSPCSTEGPRVLQFITVSEKDSPRASALGLGESSCLVSKRGLSRVQGPPLPHSTHLHLQEWIRGRSWAGGGAGGKITYCVLYSCSQLSRSSELTIRGKAFTFT